MQIDVEDVKRLSLAPGEFLVVRLAKPLRQDSTDNIRSAFEGVMPEGVRVMVLDADMDLSVIEFLPADYEARAVAAVVKATRLNPALLSH